MAGSVNNMKAWNHQVQAGKVVMVRSIFSWHIVDFIVPTEHHLNATETSCVRIDACPYFYDHHLLMAAYSRRTRDVAKRKSIKLIS